VPMSSPEPDADRYARQLLLPAFALGGQAALARAQVLVLGLGGLGQAAAAYLTGAGVGRLLLVDRDRVERSNLHRQTLYREGDLGHAKAIAARGQLSALNPEPDLQPIEADIELDPRLPEWVAAADVVLDCTDNPATRWRINATCTALKTPLVFAAAIRFEGQLSVFDPRNPASPCLGCLWGAPPDLARSCATAGVLGPLVGTLGALQAAEAIKLLLQDAGAAGLTPLVGRLWLFDLAAAEVMALKLPRSPRCPICGGA